MVKDSRIDLEWFWRRFDVALVFYDDFTGGYCWESVDNNRVEDNWSFSEDCFSFLEYFNL